MTPSNNRTKLTAARRSNATRHRFSAAAAERQVVRLENHGRDVGKLLRG